MEREWFIDGEPLATSNLRLESETADTTGIEIAEDNKGILITNMDEISVGIYTCKVSQRNFKRISEESTEEDDEIVQPLMEVNHLLGTAPTVGQNKQEDLIVLEGEMVTFNCDVSGNPTPSKTWHKVRKYFGLSFELL